MGCQMHDMGLAAEPIERPRGLQPQQSTADRHGFTALGGIGRHGVAVVEGPVGEQAGFASAVRVRGAFEGRQEGMAARRDDQDIVRFADPTGRDDEFCGAIDLDHAFTPVQPDAIFRVPGGRIDQDVIKRLGAVQDPGQHDAIVVAVGFVAEHHHIELRRTIPGQHVFDRTRAGHTIADHDQPAFRHRVGVPRSLLRNVLLRVPCQTRRSAKLRALRKDRDVR